jgi:hypothetical protein
MPLRTNVGVHRKVADNNYGSRGASVNLEMELDSSLIQEPERLQDRIHQLRRRLGEPYSGWDAGHMAKLLLGGLEGDNAGADGPSARSGAAAADTADGNRAAARPGNGVTATSAASGQLCGASRQRGGDLPAPGVGR